MAISTLVPIIISMEVDSDNDSESEYRIRYGSRVKYLTIEAGCLEGDQLSCPLDFLPQMHYDKDWITAKVYRNPNTGQLEAGFSTETLKAVENIWHSVRIDVFKLKRVEQLTGSTFTATCDCDIPGVSDATNDTFIAKIARFEWEVPRIERETRAYQLLQNEGVTCAPKFLGHLHENGRVMGILLQHLRGSAATLEDLPRCRSALQAVHSLGLLHGDVNRYNFLITEEVVKLIDFERSSEFTDEHAQTAEMQSLEDRFRDTSGEGAGFVFED